MSHKPPIGSIIRVTDGRAIGVTNGTLGEVIEHCPGSSIYVKFSRKKISIYPPEYKIVSILQLLAEVSDE